MCKFFESWLTPKILSFKFSISPCLKSSKYFACFLLNLSGRLCHIYVVETLFEDNHIIQLCVQVMIIIVRRRNTKREWNGAEKHCPWHNLNIRGVCKLCICSLETDPLICNFHSPFDLFPRNFHVIVYDQNKWGHSVHFVKSIPIHEFMILSAFSCFFKVDFEMYSEENTGNGYRNKMCEENCYDWVASLFLFVFAQQHNKDAISIRNT